MTTDIPRPSFEDSVRILSQRDEFKVIIESIEGERNALLQEMSDKTEPFEIVKLNGEQSGLTRLLSQLQVL